MDKTFTYGRIKYKRIGIPGDGNCFYAALIHQLLHVGVDKLSIPGFLQEVEVHHSNAPQQLREMIVAYASSCLSRTNFDLDIATILQGQQITSDMLRQSLRPGVWDNDFGDIVIGIAKRIFGKVLGRDVNIVVFDSRPGRNHLYPDPTGVMLHLVYNGQHYDSTRPVLTNLDDGDTKRYKSRNRPRREMLLEFNMKSGKQRKMLEDADVIRAQLQRALEQEDYSKAAHEQDKLVAIEQDILLYASPTILQKQLAEAQESLQDFVEKTDYSSAARVQVQIANIQKLLNKKSLNCSKQGNKNKANPFVRSELGTRDSFVTCKPTEMKLWDFGTRAEVDEMD